MFRRALFLVVGLCLVAWTSQAIQAADDKTHEGTVVKAGEGKLTMTMKGDTKEHTHAVAKDAKITIDGKPAHLADLKAGYHVIVTPHGDHGIVKIVAHSKSKQP